METGTETGALALFWENYRAIRAEFRWQPESMKRLAAFALAAKGRRADMARMRSAYDRIRQSAGFFSPFRQSIQIVAAAMDCASERRDFIESCAEGYSILRKAGFRSSEFTVAAAAALTDLEDPRQMVLAAERAMGFFKGIRQNHFFAAGQDDYIFAVLLGMGDSEISRGVEKIENFYAALKPEFLSAGGVLALAQTLFLCGAGDDGAARVTALARASRAVGTRLDRRETLAVLGVLAVAEGSEEELIGKIARAEESLKTKKGFGALSVSRRERLLFCAGLTATETAKEKSGALNAALSASIINIVIAQQAAAAAAASGSS